MCDNFCIERTYLPSVMSVMTEKTGKVTTTKNRLLISLTTPYKERERERERQKERLCEGECVCVCVRERDRVEESLREFSI